MVSSKRVGAVVKLHELLAMFEKWRPPIAAWAVSKGWMNVDKPRSMLELLFLIGSEFEELKDGIMCKNDANVMEELADIFIRAAQMMEEWRLPAVTDLSDAAPHAAKRLDFWAVGVSAGELGRDLDYASHLSAVTVRLVTQMIVAVQTVEAYIGHEMALADFDDAVEQKMAKNEKRPYRHGRGA